MPDFVSPHQANRSFANAVFLGQRIVRFGLNLLANASYHFPRDESFGCVNAYGTGFLTDDADEE